MDFHILQVPVGTSQESQMKGASSDSCQIIDQCICHRVRRRSISSATEVSVFHDWPCSSCLRELYCQSFWCVLRFKLAPICDRGPFGPWSRCYLFLSALIVDLFHTWFFDGISQCPLCKILDLSIDAIDLPWRMLQQLPQLPPLSIIFQDWSRQNFRHSYP